MANSWNNAGNNWHMCTNTNHTYDPEPGAPVTNLQSATRQANLAGKSPVDYDTTNSNLSRTSHDFDGKVGFVP